MRRFTKLGIVIFSALFTLTTMGVSMTLAAEAEEMKVRSDEIRHEMSVLQRELAEIHEKLARLVEQEAPLAELEEAEAERDDIRQKIILLEKELGGILLERVKHRLRMKKDATQEGGREGLEIAAEELRKRISVLERELEETKERGGWLKRRGAPETEVEERDRRAKEIREEINVLERELKEIEEAL